jgi:endonuclease-3
MTQEHTRQIIRELARSYPGTGAFLRHKSPFHFLCSVILSAQCTDERVNRVSPALWAKYPTPGKMAGARLRDVEKIIRSTGFYHNKAKNLVACAKYLLEVHKGVIPDNLEELTKVPGVGRKTANVVLGEIFGKAEGIVVDTHVIRLSNRLGFTSEKDAVKIEQDLMRQIPEKDRLTFSHRLIQHGRRICGARKPLCSRCTLAGWCPSRKMFIQR